jgi:hypothetical protein
MPARLTGALLFLPVPLVLFLFTRAPLGILPSLAIGIVLALTHRLYARPWALARARQRCLFCGADVGAASRPSVELAIEDPLGGAIWCACRAAHARALGAALAWADRRRGWLKLGILGTLLVFLVCGTASAFRSRFPWVFDDAVAFLRLDIALTVLPLGWLATRHGSTPIGPARAPFPLHVPALVGLRTVLWLFRLVGLLWLAQGSLHLAHAWGL